MGHGQSRSRSRASDRADRDQGADGRSAGRTATLSTDPGAFGGPSVVLNPQTDRCAPVALAGAGAGRHDLPGPCRPLFRGRARVTSRLARSCPMPSSGRAGPVSPAFAPVRIEPLRRSPADAGPASRRVARSSATPADRGGAAMAVTASRSAGVIACCSCPEAAPRAWPKAWPARGAAIRTLDQDGRRCRGRRDAGPGSGGAADRRDRCEAARPGDWWTKAPRRNSP